MASKEMPRHRSRHRPRHRPRNDHSESHRIHKMINEMERVLNEFDEHPEETVEEQGRKGRNVAAELHEGVEDLKRAATEFVEHRKETVKVLREIVKDLRQCREYTSRVQAVSAGVGLLGAGLTLAGAMFPDNKDVYRAGAFLGDVGTLVNAGGIAVDKWSSYAAEKEVKRVLAEDHKAYDKFVEEMERCKWSMNEVKAATRQLSDVCREGSLFKFISEAGKELDMGPLVTESAVITIAAVPINLHSLITNLNPRDPAVVRAIEKIIKNLECSEEEIADVPRRMSQCFQMENHPY